MTTPEKTKKQEIKAAACVMCGEPCDQAPREICDWCLQKAAADTLQSGRLRPTTPAITPAVAKIKAEIDRLYGVMGFTARNIMSLEDLLRRPIAAPNKEKPRQIHLASDYVGKSSGKPSRCNPVVTNRWDDGSPSFDNAVRAMEERGQ